MLHALQHSLSERRDPLPAPVASAVCTAGVVIATLVAVMALFFGMFLSHAH